MVHQLRVLTKRLRAAWHLAQPVGGKKLARQRRADLRKLSSMVAVSRDQSVQLALLEKFHHKHPEIPRESLNSLFQTSPSNLAAPQSPSPTAIRAILQAEILAWKNIQLGEKERCVLRHRWRCSLKKARGLARQISKSTDPELWHCWRKAVKRLRYQREFLAKINPRGLGKRDLRIRNLGTRLGDHNDLSIFWQYLDSTTLESGDLKALKKAVAMEDHQIKRNCRRLGRKLFGP